MTDKELADRVVGLGVGAFLPMMLGKIYIRSYDTYGIDGHEFTSFDASDPEYFDASDPEYYFVRDWRVAGALMERCEAQCVDWDELEPGHWRNMNHTSSTPRAIIEACVEALEQNDDR